MSFIKFAIIDPFIRIKNKQTRDEKIEKRVNKLPYYFYDNMEDRILSQDKQIKFLLLQIAKRQDKMISQSDLLIR